MKNEGWGPTKIYKINTHRKIPSGVQYMRFDFIGFQGKQGGQHFTHHFPKASLPDDAKP